MAGVVVLVIKPITMTLPHCLSWLLKLPIISCPLNISSFQFIIAVLKVLFSLIHTYQHFICVLRMIYNNYCNMPAGSYANLGTSCFQEINTTRSHKRPKKIELT